MGRKPINGVAMTGSERQRRHRAKSKQDRDANAHRLRAYRLERLLLRTLRELRAMERHLTERGIEPYKRGDLKLGFQDRVMLAGSWAESRSAIRVLEDLLELVDQAKQDDDATPRLTTPATPP